MANVRNMVQNVESTVGVTVLFEESLSESEIHAIGDKIRERSEVREMDFTSEEEAWETFSKDYFAGVEDLAEGFADDNPLVGSSSYQIFLNDISQQDEFVAYLQSLEGVRRVNYSNSAADGLTSFNTIVGVLSVVIIGVLLSVSVFLISNTINVAAAFRKSENQIMRYIGATNYMIRAPFVVEGVIIGLLGALIPLGCMFYLYRQVIDYVADRFQILSGIFQILPVNQIFPYMVAAATLLGLGIGFFASFLTIQKHLKV